MLGALLKALRPEQWSKNLVVFAALIFAREAANPVRLGQATIAFALFCLASSAVYLINDVLDLNADRLHPEKAKRPIASGTVSLAVALITALILMAFALVGSALFSNEFFFTALISYLILNLLYSYLLKNLVIIDVMTIAAGFVLRAVGGAVAIGVTISPWLVICATLLALFIGFGKRRHELRLLEGNAADHRLILRQYSIPLLDQLISIVTAATITAYAVYTLFGDVHTRLGVQHLELTIPFVIYGLFRYLYLIHRKEAGGSPARVLYTDLPILICVALWIAAILILMYLF